jgi:hypothetical protein
VSGVVPPAPVSAVMKFRAFLLLCCMVFVPAAAMFSHQLPPAVRALPHRLLASLAGKLAARGQREPPPVSAGPAANPTVAAVAAPPAVAGMAAAGLERTALGQLEALGAVAIECRPLPGAAGHIASCRLPVDADGQLQRVFQARGGDAETATRALTADVAAWRQRTAGQPQAQPRLW